MPFTPVAMFEVVRMVAKRPITAGGRRLAQTAVPARPTRARRTASTTLASCALASRRLLSSPAQPKRSPPGQKLPVMRGYAHTQQASGLPRPTLARRGREQRRMCLLCVRTGLQGVKRAGYVMRCGMRSCRKLWGSQDGSLIHACRSISSRSAACAGYRGQPSCL